LNNRTHHTVHIGTMNHSSRQHRILFLATGIVLLAMSQAAWAWGPEGHVIVGRIAELHLSPAALKAVTAALNSTNDPASHIRISDSGIANWPDRIRSDRPESGPWHFVDIPFTATGYEVQRDCTEHQGCVVEAVERFRKEWVDPQATYVTRNEALRFLVHFMGDIHQPLHCAERNGDKGGNLCLVLMPGDPKPVKLHAVWDGTLLRKSLRASQLTDLGYAEKLNAAIKPSQRTAWLTGKAVDWANESHKIAVEQVYHSIPSGGSPATLKESYIESGQALVDQQLMKAGLRLAALLNAAVP
jgi:hypothetical protein